jgi:hypothetical protein
VPIGRRCQLQGQVDSSRPFNYLTLKVKARQSFETSGSTGQTTKESCGKNVEFVLIELKKKVELCYLLFHGNNNVTLSGAVRLAFEIFRFLKHINKFTVSSEP